MELKEAKFRPNIQSDQQCMIAREGKFLSGSRTCGKVIMKATEACDKGKRAEEENKKGDEGHSEIP